MNKKELRADFLLMITAALWGVNFVFQKMATNNLEALSYNGLRFLIAGFALIPVVYGFSGGKGSIAAKISPNKWEVLAGACAGAALFLAALLQQIGVAHMSAGKAAFITGLYIVIVPLYGLFFKQRPHITIWLAVLLAVAGMYFLTMDGQFTLQKGDLVVFVGAFLWAAHIVVVDFFNPKVNPLKFSWLQFVFAALFSLIAALFFEPGSMTVANIAAAKIPLLYSGVCSAAIGYTFQILGQRDAKPAPATLILSMESVFAVAAGYFILGEILGSREIFGCLLMTGGMLLAQYRELTRRA